MILLPSFTSQALTEEEEEEVADRMVEVMVDEEEEEEEVEVKVEELVAAAILPVEIKEQHEWYRGIQNNGNRY